MNNKITLQDIAESLLQKYSMDRKDAEAFVKGIFDLIEESLVTDKLVKIKGFGTFKIIDVESRESINVNTGERFVIEGHSKISFIPDSSLKNLINKPFSHFETVVLNDNTNLEDTDIVEENPSDIASDESCEDLQNNYITSENGPDNKEVVEEHLENIDSDKEVGVEENSKVEEPALNESVDKNNKSEEIEKVSESDNNELHESEEVEKVSESDDNELHESEEELIEEVDQVDESTSDNVEDYSIKSEEAEETEEAKEELEVISYENISKENESEIVEEENCEDKSTTEDNILINDKYKDAKTISREPIKPIRHHRKRERNINIILYIVILLIIGFAIYLFFNLTYKNPDFVETPFEDSVVVNNSTALKESVDSINNPKTITSPSIKALIMQEDDARKDDSKVDSKPESKVDSKVDNKSESKPVEKNDEIKKNSETTQKIESTNSEPKEEISSGVLNNMYDENINYTISGTKVTHTLKDGETIMKVSLMYYGSKKLYRYILEYNKETLGEDGNKVRVGTKIKVPELKPTK